jgi:flagellar hook-length control protein FliK
MAKSVIDQIVAKASVNREGELTELSLQLHPETLGRVNLRLSMAGGVLSAKVMVDNPAVKAALEANLADLRQSLADQGIALQGMSVALGGQGQQHEYRDYREAAGQAAEAPGRTRSAAVRQNPVATPVRSRGAGHRLDLIV